MRTKVTKSTSKKGWTVPISCEDDAGMRISVEADLSVPGVFPDSGMPGLGFPPRTKNYAQTRSYALATWYLCMLTALLGLHRPVCP